MVEGYRKIAKQLKIPISTIRAIIKKFKATGKGQNLLGRGRMSIFTPCTVRRMAPVTKESPRMELGNCRHQSGRGVRMFPKLQSDGTYITTSCLEGCQKKVSAVKDQQIQASTVCQTLFLITDTFSGTVFYGQMRPKQRIRASLSSWTVCGATW